MQELYNFSVVTGSALVFLTLKSCVTFPAAMEIVPKSNKVSSAPNTSLVVETRLACPDPPDGGWGACPALELWGGGGSPNKKGPPAAKTTATINKTDFLFMVVKLIIKNK